MSGTSLTETRILVKNRSLWDEFDRTYNKARELKSAPPEEWWSKVREVEAFVSERTAKRPITPIELDNIFNAAKKKLVAAISAW